MKARWPRLDPVWGVLAVCGWQAADLVVAWRHSPFDRFGWLALGIWLMPALALSHGAFGPQPGTPPNSRFAWVALAFCVAGMVADFNVLQHIALAFACAAIVPRFRFQLLWLALAVAWMPVLGWVLGGLAWPAVAAVRLMTAATAAGIGLAAAWRNFRRTRA